MKEIMTDSTDWGQIDKYINIIILTLKQPGHFFKILFVNIFKANIIFSSMKLPEWIHIWSALSILMAWCFSTRASVATVLSANPHIPWCLWVKVTCGMSNLSIFGNLGQYRVCWCFGNIRCKSINSRDTEHTGPVYLCLNPDQIS